jgi:peptidoglycan hydrolase CwlO-like protein
MKINKEFVLLVIVAILLIVNLYSIKTIETDVKKYQDKINNLQINVDSIYVINRSINDKITALNSDVVIINNKIENVDKKINVIKKNTDEKIRGVDNFGINELELFFSNRYNKK